MASDVSVVEMGRRAQQAADELRSLCTAVKDQALLAMADALLERQGYLIESNAEDIRHAQEQNLPEAMIERLLLNEARIRDMASGLQEVAGMPDPIGEIVAGWQRPNGLQIQKVRVPLGVVGIIYESRPNVTVDAAALCLKSGNALILRGGSEAIHSNIALAQVIANAATGAGLPAHALQLVQTTDRSAAEELMRLNEYLDVLVPRGGAGLIQRVVETATVPVIETGVGNCHVYVDDAADLGMAGDIVFNAKVQRCSVCNAMETLLVHEAVAAQFLPVICQRLREANVELRGCPKTRALVDFAKEATGEDWDTEYLSLILAVEVVSGLDGALRHIATHGTKHSEAIVTDSYEHAQRFCQQVDAAAVYVNASTRFTDGQQFGLGAEMGISTQKLHARGPMGLQELTTVKWVVYGQGQVRS